MSGDNVSVPSTSGTGLQYQQYLPVYEQPCACDHCPTCGRSGWRRWRWPWSWPQPIWQVIPSQLPTCYIGDPPGWMGQGTFTGGRAGYVGFASATA